MPLDRNATSKLRIERNARRFRTRFGIPVTNPIDISADGTLSLTLAANPSLTVVSTGGIKLQLATGNTGLSISATGLTILTPSPSGISLTPTGIVVTTTATSGLSVTPTGLTLNTLTTKGDLLGFSTQLVRVGVGTNNFVLTADSAQAAGFRWAAAPGAGGIFTTDVKLTTVGTGFYIAEGANATMGRVTLVAGTVVVNTTKVTNASEIFLTVQQSNGGVVGAVYVSARTAGTSFTITSTSATDVSLVSWLILEPA